jgi:hypothetical protein
VDGWYDPGAQLSHDTALFPLADLPAGQASHAVAAEVSAALPGVQPVQPELRASAEKEPA